MGKNLEYFNFCSAGEIRTRDQLVTSYLLVSQKDGLYYHPHQKLSQTENARVRGASPSRLSRESTPLEG